MHHCIYCIETKLSCLAVLGVPIKWSHAINSLEALTVPLTPGGHWLLFSVTDTRIDSFKEREANTKNIISRTINTWWLLVSLYVERSHKLWLHPLVSFPACTFHRCTGSCHWVGHYPPRWQGNLAPPPDSRCPAIYYQCHLSALFLERARTEINSNNIWLMCFYAVSRSLYKVPPSCPEGVLCRTISGRLSQEGGATRLLTALPIVILSLLGDDLRIVMATSSATLVTSWPFTW